MNPTINPTINLIKANKGDIFKDGDKTIDIKNSYRLVIESNGYRYYEISTDSYIQFKIDEDNLIKLICVKINNNTNYPKWFIQGKTVLCIIDNNKINLVQYLSGLYLQKALKYTTKNENIFDLRFSNIKILEKINIKNKKNVVIENITTETINTKAVNTEAVNTETSNTETITTESSNTEASNTETSNTEIDFNTNIIVKTKNSQKFKKLLKPPIFYKENEIKIIKNFKGHKLTAGQYYGKIYNNYRLVEIINETDESNKRYYEMFLGVNKEDGEDKEDNEDNENTEDTEAIINTKFSFIFDEASLPKILKLKSNDKIFINPSWLMGTNQYIWTRPNHENLIYLHRYLMGCTIGDNTTVDHINGNILDNRLCNLRFATMSQQNMNRNNVSRKTTLNEILNPTNIPTIPKLSFDSLIFITLNTTDGLDHFSIEITKARTNIKEIREHSSKSKLLNIQEKLCHAICKRYFLIKEYPQIINDKVDAKKFATIDAFKTYCGTLITSIMNSTYTIDTFLDHLNTKNIPKYRDQRKDFLDANTEQLVLANPNAIYTLDYKYSFLDKTNSITIPIDKIKPHDLRQSGIKNKNLSTEDKLCYSIMQRYYKLVEHENTCNAEIHKDTDADSTTNFQGDTNINTTTYKTLTDIRIDDKQPFKLFDEFKTHTEMIINNIVPNHNFTLDTFAKYIIEKANHKKISNNYPKINSKYTILTREIVT
jgi:hypothetical protein